MKAAEGLTDAELAARLGVTDRAISTSRMRWEQAQKKEKDRAANFPWTISAAHTSGNLYKMMLATRFWETQQIKSPEEYRMAMQVLDTATKMDMVVAYDRDRGFYWTTKRPEDGASLFVKR